MIGFAWASVLSVVAFALVVPLLPHISTAASPLVGLAIGAVTIPSGYLIAARHTRKDRR
ncbi:hypothetical protein ACQEU3_46945 [Spirillospora sp. CA-253888]